MSSNSGATKSAQRVKVTFLFFEILAAGGLAISFVVWSAPGLLGSVQTQITRNSEAFALSLLVTMELHRRFFKGQSPWIYVWWVSLLAGYAITEFVAALPATVATLNEAFLAAILISIFLSYFGPGTRKWRVRWIYPLIAGAIVLVGEISADVFEGLSGWIVGSAESWGFVILISVLFGFIAGFPWFEAARSRVTQGMWILFLIAAPVIVSILNPNGVDSVAAVGFSASAMVWVQRVTEAFVAAVALTVLSIVLENLIQRSAEGEEALSA